MKQISDQWHATATFEREEVDILIIHLAAIAEQKLYILVSRKPASNRFYVEKRGEQI